MTFLEIAAPPGAAPVWAALSEADRAEVVSVLARLIAKTAVAQSAPQGRTDEERSDD
jgi:hypothetical protein